MDKISALTAIFLGLLTLGCSTFERSRGSGYQGRDLEPSYRFDRRTDAREQVRSELGLRNDAEGDEGAIDQRLALTRAEKTLVGKREREQYFKNKPYMRSDRERLEFLEQDSFEARQRWMNAKGITSSSSGFSPQVQYLVDTNDITLGMTKQAVRESWGEPDLVEVAGNPVYGNERWQYSEQTSSTEGYQTQRRFVYFDSGRVSGWESH